MVAQQIDLRAQQRTLARVAGAGGAVTLVVVLGSSLANGFQDAPFTSNAEQAVAFFRSVDDAFGWASSYLTIVGLIAMLWFMLGLALLLRRYERGVPWRSAFLAGAGVVSVVSGQIASWDAAVYRSEDIDPQVARYAFDLGNLSFANGWVATGAAAICAGTIFLRSARLPNWLGWWAIIAGVGQVLARAVWTTDLAFVPFTAFWLWAAVVSVMLLSGRLAVADPD
ncbi:DUF4386 family protein [Asanoa iriomotensis]|uniref:DUF4386 family protein n=1 Tax=Asanoa iriomotensis TaxID=234613 RepID=A0ABQ4CCR0_9ACTN|nr:hypothetical protein [Asanoa iriomotensis]GIF60554.1 hypothetical protein Air01nite_66490 [Asanoa iriomotensis]